MTLVTICVRALNCLGTDYKDISAYLRISGEPFAIKVANSCQPDLLGRQELIREGSEISLEAILFIIKVRHFHDFTQKMNKAIVFVQLPQGNRFSRQGICRYRSWIIQGFICIS